MSSSIVYSLHYFDGRGRAEIIRLIFVYAGQKFRDIRHSFEEWPKLKSEMPLGQVPVLEFNNQKFPQSIAIARYMAKQFKLNGKDDFESMKCNIIVDTMQEMNEIYYQVWFHIDDEKQKQEEQTKFKNEVLPEKLKGLEKLIMIYGNGTWAVGDDVTWADLLVYDSVQNFLKMDKQLLDKCRTLQKHYEAVEKLPNIVEYLINRKETPF